MSRKLTVVLLAMLVLVGAMSLKTVVVAHGDGSVIMANGSAPLPAKRLGRTAAHRYGNALEKRQRTATANALEVTAWFPQS